MSEIQKIRIEINRFVNKYNKIDKIPFEVGNGEVLYPSEMNMIDAIGNNYGTSVTQLCVVFGVTKGAVSQMVTKLANKGYVQKLRNEDYPKEVELSLTEMGQEVYRKHERFHQEMDQSMEQFINRITPEKVAIFREILQMADTHLDTYLEIRQKKI